MSDGIATGTARIPVDPTAGGRTAELPPSPGHTAFGTAADTVADLRPAAVGDVRLLVPATVSWALVGLALAWPTWVVLVVAVGLLAAAVAVCLVARWRRSRLRLAAAGAHLGGSSTPAGSSSRSRGPASPAAAAFQRAMATACLTTVLALLLAGASLAVLAAHQSVRTAGLVPALAGERAVALLEARVASDPRAVATAAARGGPTFLVRLEVERVTGRGSTSGSAPAAGAPVLLFGGPDWASVRWQERVRLTGRLAPADPGDDVVAVVTPLGGPASLAPPGVVAVVAERLRQGLRDASDGLPPDARGLLPGLVIGDRTRTPPSLTAAMQDAGLSHLDAVSGTNVAMVLGAALAACRLLGLTRRVRPIAGAGALAAFVVLARPEPSVLRAAAMGAIGLGGLLLSRRRVGLPALSGAVIVLLWVDPWLSRSFGFALSSLATAGLLLFARPWGEAMAARLPSTLRWLALATAIPLAAQVVCGPVIVMLQGSVSLVAVLANLLAAPMVAPATVLGVGALLVAPVSPPAATVLAWPAGMCTQAIAWVARTCAGLPAGQVGWPASAWGAVALALVTVLGVLLGPWLRSSVRRRPAAAVGALVVGAGVFWPTGGAVWPPPGWRLVACDVGQGDGLVLATGAGRAVVVDAGPDPDLIDGCLRSLGVDTVDAVVLTHFHADHVEGLPGVLRGRSVRQLLVSPAAEPDYQAREVQRWADAAAVPVTTVYAGDVLRYRDLTARVLWPARIIREGSVPNNASVVLDVDVGGLRVLLLGDVEEAAARQVTAALERGPPGRPGSPASPVSAGAGPPVLPDFDVLKVAHHGSRLFDPELYAVRAPLALISVGRDNDYGHPAESTLRALRGAGHQVVRTDQVGDIAVTRSADGALRLATHR